MENRFFLVLVIGKYERNLERSVFDVQTSQLFYAWSNKPSETVFLLIHFKSGEILSRTNPDFISSSSVYLLVVDVANYFCHKTIYRVEAYSAITKTV